METENAPLVLLKIVHSHGVSSTITLMLAVSAPVSTRMVQRCSSWVSVTSTPPATDFVTRRGAESDAIGPHTMSLVPAPQLTAAPPFDDFMTWVRDSRAGAASTWPMPSSKFTPSEAQ